MRETYLKMKKRNNYGDTDRQTERRTRHVKKRTRHVKTFRHCPTALRGRIQTNEDGQILTIVSRYRVLQQAPQQPKKVTTTKTLPMPMRMYATGDNRTAKSTEGVAAVVADESNSVGNSTHSISTCRLRCFHDKKHRDIHSTACSIPT